MSEHIESNNNQITSTGYHRATYEFSDEPSRQAAIEQCAANNAKLRGYAEKQLGRPLTATEWRTGEIQRPGYSDSMSRARNKSRRVASAMPAEPEQSWQEKFLKHREEAEPKTIEDNVRQSLEDEQRAAERAEARRAFNSDPARLDLREKANALIELYRWDSEASEETWDNVTYAAALAREGGLAEAEAYISDLQSQRDEHIKQHNATLQEQMSELAARMR